MKAIFYLSVTILGLFTMHSCVKDTCVHTKKYLHYEPVFITQEEFDAPAEYTLARPMENTGTIYAYGSYIFVNEFQRGIHIIDNHNPQSPNVKGFIEIPGNTHFTVKSNMLYANKLEDLVVLDITNVDQPLQVNRISDVFQLHRAQSSDQGILAYYESTDEAIEIDCNDQRYNSLIFSFNDRLFFDFEAFTPSANLQFAAVNNAKAVVESGNSPSTIGVGGSMARFTTFGEYLYVLSDHSLETIDITTPDQPVKHASTNVAFTAETIYPFEGHLYIGTTNGMHIYNVSHSGTPEFVSTTAHIQSCDPVISDGEYAYVTLRGGTECGGFTNQLEAYDIQNPFTPTRVQIFPMDNPHGLTKVGDYLYICEGPGGWKKVKSNLPGQFTLEQTNSSHSAYDVLVTPQFTLLIVGSKGIFQYSMDGVNNPQLISQVEFVLP